MRFGRVHEFSGAESDTEFTVMLALSFSVQAFNAPSRFASSAPRAAISPMMAAWSGVVDGAPRSANLAALDALSEAGDATMWNSMKLSARPVSLGELSRTTKIDEKALDPTATEFSLEDIQDTFIKVIVGCTVGAIGWAVGSDALGLDAGLRFAGTYLFAGIPIGVLAIGSTAPGVLFLPIEAYRAATASADEKKLRDQRVCKHEASHLLCAYVLGMPVQEVAVDPSGKGPRVVVYDEELATAPGQLVKADQLNKCAHSRARCRSNEHAEHVESPLLVKAPRPWHVPAPVRPSTTADIPPSPPVFVCSLAVVAMSGFMAESDAFGKAVGATEDFKLLNTMMLRCNPPLPAQKQQDLSRYAALMAWSIIKKHECAFDAITTALQEGKGLAECLKAAEEAEAGQSVADAAAKAERAEALAKETPQQRAAREREEMAARGRF